MVSSVLVYSSMGREGSVVSGVVTVVKAVPFERVMGCCDRVCGPWRGPGSIRGVGWGIVEGFL